MRGKLYQTKAEALSDVLPAPCYATAWASLGFLLERFIVRETPSPTFLIRIAEFVSRSMDSLQWLHCTEEKL